jgi:hypothetical protein
VEKAKQTAAELSCAMTHCLYQHSVVQQGHQGCHAMKVEDWPTQVDFCLECTCKVPMVCCAAPTQHSVLLLLDLCSTAVCPLETWRTASDLLHSMYDSIQATLAINLALTQ